MENLRNASQAKTEKATALAEKKSCAARKPFYSPLRTWMSFQKYMVFFSLEKYMYCLFKFIVWKFKNQEDQVGNAIPYDMIHIFIMIFSKQIINIIKPALWPLIDRGWNSRRKLESAKNY